MLTPTTEMANQADMHEVDAFIDELIVKHSKNSEMLNLMALEATSLATSVESRSRGLESQGLMTRFLNSVSGKNQKISARNSRDLAKSQYLGQQMLNKLAENNLMTFQMVVALGDKVNRVALDCREARHDIIQINQSLAAFFEKIRLKLEAAFTTLQRNDDLLFWKETMMFAPIYQNKTYPELSRPEKIVCLANEFYTHSQQQWGPRDLMFLKSILVQVGHSPDELVTLKEIYTTYQDDTSLLTQLFKGVDAEPDLTGTTELTPTLMTFNKLQTFKDEDAHIVDTIEQFSPDTPRNKICLELTSNYITKQTGRDLNHEMPIFDAVMNLVEDLTFYKQLQHAELVQLKQLELEHELKVKEEVEAKEKALSIESQVVTVPKNAITSSDGFNKFAEGQIGSVKVICVPNYLSHKKPLEILSKETHVIYLGAFEGIEENMFTPFRFNNPENIFGNYFVKKNVPLEQVEFHTMCGELSKEIPVIDNDNASITAPITEPELMSGLSLARINSKNIRGKDIFITVFDLFDTVTVGVSDSFLIVEAKDYYEYDAWKPDFENLRRNIKS